MWTVQRPSPCNIQNTGRWMLECLNQYNGKHWTKTESKIEGDLQLFLQDDNIHITHGNVLMEQLCLSGDKKVNKAIFHQNTLGFAIHRPQGITKFNVKFSPKCLNIDVCLKYIGMYMRIQRVNPDGVFQEDLTMKTVVEKVLQKGPLNYLQGNTNMVPRNYPVEQIVQLCLLDRELANFVVQVDTILKQYVNQTDKK